MDSASDKNLKIFITNHQVYDIANWLNKNLKMQFVLLFYKELGLRLTFVQKKKKMQNVCHFLILVIRTSQQIRART